MNKDKEIIFFAYQGNNRNNADENVDAIHAAIKEYNRYQSTYEARSWEDYKKTTPINIDILEAINKSAVFVCDLSYSNHNVLFELGYAVGKNKEILILLNENINHSITTYKSSFLRNIRYTSFTNSQDIRSALQQKHQKSGLLKQYVNIIRSEDSINVFYIQSKIRNEPSLKLSQGIEKIRNKRNFSLVTDDTYEVSYQPFNWYLQNIYKSSHVIIHLLGTNIENSFPENANKSFIAGLAYGLGCKVLLTAPSQYKAPLDYEDILIQYSTSENLVEEVINWLDKNIPKIQKTEIKNIEDRELDLIKLGIGCEIAEYEKDALLNYFIETASYNEAVNRENSILVVGRKGTGKSAIYIKVSDELMKDNLNYIVNLRPESDELLEDVDLSKLYENPATKKTFFFSIWKQVIFSKLIQSICERLIAKPNDYSYSPAENAVIKFVEDHEQLIDMNAFGVMQHVSQKLNKGNSLKSPEILQDLYKNYLTPLIKLVKDYFNSINSKYYKIIVLADNLDRTWDSQNDLDVQAELIVSLLDVENKIKNELKNNRDEKFDVKIREIVFLRKDIFDYIIKTVPEPDKLTIMSHEINWEKYPNLLKRVIEDRFKYNLNLQNEGEVNTTWNNFFDISPKKTVRPFDVIKDIITCRPRDAIYFVSRLFESAVNSGHKKVESSDLNSAIESYTTFLNNNLIAETKAEYPEIVNILSKLQEQYGKKLEYSKFSRILASFGYKEEKMDKLVNVLLTNGYIICFYEKTREIISDIDTLKKILKEKKFLVFTNKVYVIAHAKYFLIKYKMSLSPF